MKTRYLFLIIAIVFLLLLILVAVVTSQPHGGADANNLWTIPRAHGIMGFTGETETITISDGDWHQVTNGTDNLFVSIDFDHMTMLSGDTIQIDFDGDYSITVSLSFSGPATAEIWSIAVHCNGISCPPIMQRKTSNQDIGNVSVVTYIQASAGDLLTLEIRNDTQPGNVVLNACAFKVIRLTH